MENNLYFPFVKEEMIKDTKLNLLLNGGSPQSNECLVRGKAHTPLSLYVSVSGHQLLHPLTMFDNTLSVAPSALSSDPSLEPFPPALPSCCCGSEENGS